MAVDKMRDKYPAVSEEYLTLLSHYQDFVNKEIMPYRRDLDGGSLHKDEALALRTVERIHQKTVDFGMQKSYFPKELGGLGLGSIEFNVTANEEVARGDCGIASSRTLSAWAFTPALLAPNMRLLTEYAPRICGEKTFISCVAMTEPDGGCNLMDPAQCGRTIKTTARLDGDEWVINGQKLWPSGTGTAEIYLTLCTTDASKGEEGIALIYVPKDTPGLSFGVPEAKMGLIYTEHNGAIYYDNVRVPKDYRVAGPGTDAKILHDTLSIGRIGTCALALGPAQAALEIALDYTKERYIAGKQVREHSMHAGVLADMVIAIESARAYYIQVSKMADNPNIYGRVGDAYLHGKASAAKVLACDTAVMVTNRAMELMGSMGCSEEMHVEKYLRDVKIMQLVEGGSHLGRLDTIRALYPFNW